MEEQGSDFRRWDELIPDALGLIFSNLSLQETLTVIPRVCKSWRKTVMGPYCWQEIDIEEWSRYCPHESRERMLQMLIGRSCGSLRRLCVSDLRTDQSLSFIADHAKSLHTLRLPRSEMSDSIVEQIASRLSFLTFLDISSCSKIGAPALEAIGKHCKNLTTLCRIMHPLAVIDRLSQDDEAFAIASTMPNLKHLELAYVLISTEGVRAILGNCCQLEFLDIRGCWDVKLEETVINGFSRVKIMGPYVMDCYETNGWENCSDYSNSSSGYLAWDFVAGDFDEFDDELSDNGWEDHQSMEDVELRFYDGLDFDNAAFDWPQSP